MGGTLHTDVGLTVSVSRGTDQLRVVNVAPSTVASALSPGSLLFPFSDSGFASLSASSSFRPFSLPPPPLLPSSASLSSSSFSSLASSSFSSSLSIPPFPLPPSPAFPSPLAPPSASFPASSSLSASAAVRPPPGFAPPTPSVSPPLPSSSFPSASADPLYSSSLPPVCVSFSAGQAAPVLSSSSSSSFSSSPLDLASMLGLSQDYQSLACWYFLLGVVRISVRISLLFILTFLLMRLVISPLAGSSVFFSAVRAVASSVPLPAVSSAAPLPSVARASSSRPPAPLLQVPPFSASSAVSAPPLPSRVSPLGRGLYALGSAPVLPPAPPGFPPHSAPSALLSVPPPAVPPSFVSPSRPPGVSVLSPPTSSLLPSAPFAWPVSSAPALGSSPVFSDASRLPSGPLPPLLHPGPVCDPPVLSAASALPPFCSAPLGSTAGPSGFASPSAGSTFGLAGSAPQPGPSSAFPPLSGASAALSAPPLSDFDYGPDDPFAPGFASGAAVPDPEAPAPPPLSDSERAEVRRMYQYLVDLFPQAAGSSQAPLPPRALFEEFFALPSSPHQPVFLTWFERVHSTLSEADARIVSLLASGRPESSLLPPR